MQVKKRNGNFEPFDKQKIITAIQKAFLSCDENVNDEVIEEIADQVSVWDEISIEDIQDEVIELLADYGFEKIAQNYKAYKDEQSLIRYISSRLDYMHEYMTSGQNAATSSETDANANVTVKNVANLENENSKVLNRKIQRYRMKHQLKKQFPEVASQYEKDVESHIIYVHDEASSPVVKNYCEAVTLYPLMIEGTKGLDNLNVTPPHNLTSFCGQFINMVFLLSAQCKGAVGLAEFFNFFDYFAAKEWGEEYHLHENEYVDTELCLNRKTIGERINQHFQNVVYNLNQSAGNRGNQSPFTNFNYFDCNYWHALFDEFEFPDGAKPSWERVSFLQKKFMKWFNNERTKTVLTFPVESMLLLTDGDDVIDKEYKDFTAEMYAEGHSFFTYLSSNPNAVASCCRLRNELSDNTFMKTIGLAGVQTGSCNVITLNLNRIVQNWDREHNNKTDIISFKEYLKVILERVYKYHIAYKTLLYEVEDLGMFTSSNAGFIKMNKLFSTVSINGHNEMAEYLGFKVSNNPEYIEFMSDILAFIDKQNKEHSTKGFIMNLECAPAEGLGSKNYNWDKADGYKVPENRVLYNSYFYDAHDPHTSILDKFVLHGGKIANSCSGGQAIHANVDSHLSKEQYLKLIDFAIKQDASYFTFNIPNTECKDCGHIIKKPISECPICKSKNLRYWTRVVGFLRPIDGFDKYRQIEASKRIYNHEI